MVGAASKNGGGGGEGSIRMKALKINERQLRTFATYLHSTWSRGYFAT